MDGNEKAIAILSGLLSLAVTWAWYFASAQNQELAAWILVSAFMSASLVAMAALWYLATKASKWTLFAAILAFFTFLSFTIICIFYWVDEGIDGQVAAQVLAYDYTYWTAMTAAVLTLCNIPAVSAKYVNQDSDDKVHRARHVALVLVWCVLDVYTLYLLHEIAKTVLEYDDPGEMNGTSFDTRWTASLNITNSSKIACNLKDTEMQTYGLLYQDQISHTETTRFLCAYELHEAVRLNALCAVVVWTIYRLSAHTSGIELLTTGLVFLAISTTVDDLRSYWVLRLEQAAFLTLAACLHVSALFNGSKKPDDNEPESVDECGNALLTNGLLQPSSELDSLLGTASCDRPLSVRLDF